MPMYEKGSVRAGPRSKQQERMKKIMKKFLSSLLALTMILSLVIVPANAADDSVDQNGFSVSVKGGKTSAVVGDEVTFVANAPSTVTVTDGDNSETSYTGRVTAYSWSIGNAYTAGTTTNEREFTATAKTAAESGDTIKATCEFTVSYEKTSGSTTTIKVSKTASLSVVSKQDAFAAAVKGATVTYQGRNYTISNDMKVTIAKFENDPAFSAENVKLGTVSSYPGAKITKNGGNWSIKSSDETLSVCLTVTPQNVTPSVSLALDDYATANGVRKGQTVTVTATYTGGINANTATYKWTVSDQTSEFTANGKTLTFVPKNTGSYTVTCKVSEGLSTDVAQKTTDAITVNPDSYDVVKDNFSTSMAPGEVKPFSVKTTGAAADANDYSVKWTSSNTSVADFTTLTKDKQIGMLKANNKSGSTTVTAKVTFKNKVYTVSGDVSVSAADATLDEITNGSSDYLSDSSLKDIVAQAIKKSTGSTVSTSKINTIKVATGGFPSHVTLYEDEVKSANKITSTTKDLTNVDYLYFDTDAGYIGTAELNLDVTLTGESGTIAVTLYIPVVGDETIKDTVTGTSANKEVSFTNDDYAYLYYSYSKPTYEGYFNGGKVDGFEYPVKENKTVTVPASKFSGSNKTVTLYVVGVDNKGVASTGTITVSQKSYDINYNVVAGKSVSFNQKDFEDFLENYADDNGEYNSRKDELSFDHAVLTSSIPSTRSEGTLYYGSTEITSSNKSKTDMTDMDKVSFDSVSKPSKDTVSLTFRVYGDLYKDGSRTKKEVKYDVNVVISVVKEDITYTVGIDDTVQLTARDFVNFLQDAKTSYRKAELDYVKFDVSGKNVSSYAYGGLYRSYSSYSTGKLADSTDKFYYEPSRTQYDLADVAYHTTRWAEAGKTVYIPFTVYGTKNEEASGTMAITIAQTMNFIDVKASDFFYEPVKWAVNNKITNGTSSTTFSPYKNCNRAEIVTFLWRAAGSPEPTVTRNPFTDVNSVRDASYYKAILWASQKGITAGSTATTFSPYQECTRSQIVTFLYRYAGKPSGYYSNPFKDVSSVNEASYYNAILWAVGKGITQGTSTTTFSPYASCTRGEAVTFLYRYVNGVK